MTVVAEFHRAFDQPAPDAPPLLPDRDLVHLRMRLIREEVNEVMEELIALSNTKDPVKARELLRKLLKELADLRYVTEGAAVTFGLPIDEAYAEVHRSNMSKLGEDGRPVKRDDGKVLKSDRYRPADMYQFVPDIIDIQEG